jgi:hypothetical protein
MVNNAFCLERLGLGDVRDGGTNRESGDGGGAHGAFAIFIALMGRPLSISSSSSSGSRPAGF